MDLSNIFCHNLDCPARGQTGQGNITVHSQKEGRCQCNVCGTTFSTKKGTIFYRLKTAPATVILVLTLLAYGCPIKAIVVAFGFDERTVKNWWERAGNHSQAVHKHVVGQSQLDLEQAQADELKGKIQGRSIWMAMAIMVSTRLWLGGVVSERRDKHLLNRLAEQIRNMALCRPLLLAVDGLPGYVNAFQQAFRTKQPREGQPGRCRWHSWPDIAIVQVIKRRAENKLSIERRIVQGGKELVERLLTRSQGGGTINTAYIERLNGTFRQRLNSLARRTRTLAAQPETLQAGMYVIGCIYNFCTYHQSLRVPYHLSEHSQRWLQRTPAIAAGLTDHCWTVEELFSFKVPPPRWSPPKKRGRSSKETLALIERWCQ